MVVVVVVCGGVGVGGSNIYNGQKVKVGLIDTIYIDMCL